MMTNYSDEWDSDEYDSWDETEDTWDEEPTVACPECNAEVHEDSVRCPVCGNYITWTKAVTVRPRWWTSLCRWMAVILVFALLFPFLAMLYQLFTHPPG
ncbi:MAG: hypothetical protein VB878_06560 [Pirellulaceae bacterium]